MNETRQDDNLDYLNTILPSFDMIYRFNHIYHSDNDKTLESVIPYLLNTPERHIQYRFHQEYDPNEGKKSYLEEIPNDMFNYICNYLPITNISRLMRTNRAIHKYLQSDLLWMNLLIMDFGFIKPEYKNSKDWKKSYMDESMSMNKYGNQLQWAIINHYPKMVYRIINKPNYIISNDSSIHWCVKSGTVEILKILFDRGFKINNETECPLVPASEKEDLEMCRLLIQNGGDVMPDRVHPLYSASQTGKYNILEVLLKAGSNVNMGFNGNHPLFIASQQGHVNCVKLLCEYNAEVNKVPQIPNGCTALYVACQNGHEDVVKILLSYGARHDLLYNGFSPLYVSSQKGYFNIVKLLCEAGADINHLSLANTTAMYIACRFGYIEIARYLMKRRANIEFRSSDGYTPLFVACINDYYNIVILLCQNNAKIDVVNNRGDKLYDLAMPVCKKILDVYKPVIKS